MQVYLCFVLELPDGLEPLPETLELLLVGLCTQGRALSRLSGAATLDTGILGSECAGAQDAGGQRNEHCAKNSFPNSLFHGKVLSVVCCILSVALTVRSRHCQNHPNQSRLN